MTPDLFEWAERRSLPPDEFDPERDRATVSRLAREGVFIGTSSWKYPGWIGKLYARSRYESRGRFSTPRFEKECLREYASVFPTVCVDGAFYTFPSEALISGLAERVHEGFRFGFKTTDTITMRSFPTLPRYGAKAGQPNADFLNADLFSERFLTPLRLLGNRLGVVMLEFTRFSKGTFGHPMEFAGALDQFISSLNDPPQMAVEIRNTELLGPGLLEVLRRHVIGYVYNQWSHMPPVGEQIARVGEPPGGFVTARFLLADGRVYRDAVESFSPYDRTRIPHSPSRAAARELVEIGRKKLRPSFLFVNNRLEGNALNTIAAVVNGVG